MPTQEDLAKTEAYYAQPQAQPRSYSGSNAASYAYQWYNGHNTQYPKFSANCTNFVSQCLRAGGYPNHGSLSVPDAYTYVQNATSIWTTSYKDFYNPSGYPYYTRGYITTSSFIRVVDFKTYWGSTRVQPYWTYTNNATNRNTMIGLAKVGDVILWADANGKPTHAALITKKANSTMYLTYQTNNVKDKNFHEVDSPKIILIRM